MGLIADVGRALYGPDSWKTQLADALGVTTRVLRRWELGRVIPADVWLRCLDLIERKEQEIAALKRSIGR